MPFTRGVSGNPAGRPKNFRALTKLIETKMDQQYTMHDGRTMTAKEIVAEQIVDGLVAGIVTLQSGRQLTFTKDDWQAAVRFVFNQVDGLPRAGVDVDIYDEGLLSMPLLIQRLSFAMKQINPMIVDASVEDNGASTAQDGTTPP